MVFHRGRRKTLNNVKLQTDDKIIKESPHIKYLGVILDTKLKDTETDTDTDTDNSLF